MDFGSLWKAAGMAVRMKVCVLGGTGFIGSHLVDRLRAAGHEVTVVARSRAGVGAQYVVPLPGVRFVRSDLADLKRLRSALAGCEVVYHLISTTVPGGSNRQPVFDVRTNLVGALRLIDLCRELRTKRLVFISSGGSVYGPAEHVPIPEDAPTQPISSHGIVKLAIEQYLGIYQRAGELDSVILRVANAFGERQDPERGQGVVAAFAARLLRREPLEIWGDGQVIRDYVYVGDVVDALLIAATAQPPDRVFNVGTGSGRSVLDVAERIGAVLGLPAELIFRSGRPADVPVNVLDIARARDQLGWQPETSFEEGLKRTSAWLRATLGDADYHLAGQEPERALATPPPLPRG